MTRENFDFNTVSELEEKLDYSKLLSCPKCKKPIPVDSMMCLYCGEEVVFDRKKSFWIVWVAIAMIIIFGLVMLF